jgi:hypothetical protein
MIKMSREILVSGIETGDCSGHGHGEGLGKIGKCSGALSYQSIRAGTREKWL